MDLKNSILVASPTLRCPFFHRTVVLLVDHREEGSLGFVVNKPSESSLEEVLTQVGLEDRAETGEPGGPLLSPVMLGGPVSTNTGWVVFDTEASGLDFSPTLTESILDLDNGIGVCANLDMLEHIVGGRGPDRFLMMLGYAGWGPGQLDDEIREGSWIPVDLDPRLLFATPVEDRWTSALAKMGIDPARMTAAVVAEA